MLSPNPKTREEKVRAARQDRQAIKAAQFHRDTAMSDTLRGYWDEVIRRIRNKNA